ncbi:hypothetical protein ABZP36_031327 [Zizania latifolia]
MATESWQAQAPAMPAMAERAGGSRVAMPPPPPPRRGQIKERIMRDVAATLVSIFTTLLRADKSGGGFRVPDDDTAK